MKKYDVVAVTGEYTNAQGEVKKRYQNVGAIIDKGNGPFLVLEKWFNPAGLDKPVLSLFAPKGQQQQNQPPAQNSQPVDDMNQDIPF